MKQITGKTRTCMRKSRMTNSRKLPKCEIPEIVLLTNFHHFFTVKSLKLDEFVHTLLNNIHIHVTVNSRWVANLVSLANSVLRI